MKLAPFFDRLLTKRTHVKPLNPTLFSGVWLVLKLNTIESFSDDWRRFGLWVALSNLWALLKAGQ